MGTDPVFSLDGGGIGRCVRLGVAERDAEGVVDATNRAGRAGHELRMRDMDGAVDGEGSGGVVDERAERAGVELEVVPPDLDGIDIVAECPSQGRDQRRDRGQYLGRVPVRDDEARVGIGLDELRNRLEMHR